MIKAVILKFEQIDHEEYKTIPHIKEFSDQDRIGDIKKWIKEVDPSKKIQGVYFSE